MATAHPRPPGGYQGPGLALPAAPTAPRTYADLYRGRVDVLAGHYAPLLGEHDPADPALTPAVLLQNLLASDDAVPKVWLALVPGRHAQGTPVVRVLHSPRTYPARATQPTVWDGQVFAFSSDVFPGGSIATVEFPASAFRLTSNVQVPSSAAVMDHLWIEADAGGVPAPLLGPYAAGTPDTRVIRTRRMIRVPHKYVGLVLGERLEPRQLY